jgi:hypothetical protein
MDHLTAHAAVLVIALLIAGVMSVRIQQSDVADLVAEQEGQSSKKGQQLEALLQLQQLLQSSLLLFNLFWIVLLWVTHDLILSIILAFGWLIVIHYLAGTDWMHRAAQAYAMRHRRGLFRAAASVKPVLDLLDNVRFVITRRPSFASKAELINAISKSQDVLTKRERKELIRVLSGELQHQENLKT